MGSLYGESGKIAGGYGIHAQSIANVVQVSDFPDIVNQAKSTEGIYGLIFRSFDYQSFVSTVGNFGQLTAGEETFGA